MDKQNILNHYKNIVDKEGVFLKSLDLIQNVIKYFESVVTPFLTPEMRVVLEDILRFESGIAFTRYGGFDDAERIRLAIYQDYMAPPEVDSVICGIRLNYKQKFNKLSHRDCLGAILGLGITRQKIGDINVTDDFIDVVLDPEINQYILNNIEKIG